MDIISGFFSIIMILSGLTVTIALRGFQFRHIGESFRVVFSLKTTRNSTSALLKHKSSSPTPFQAMASALGGSIGTANIAGTAGAIAIGGAGAVFYMWLAAILGMALKFSEIVLAVKYREKRCKEYIGGPMIYIEKGIKQNLLKHFPYISMLSKPLACSYAIFTLLSSAFGTPIVQSNTVATSVAYMVRSFSPNANVKSVMLIAGIICAVLTGIVVIGGAKRIGSISAVLVPFMALFYIAVCIVVLLRFNNNVFPSLIRIFKEAFGFRQFGGGVCGICITNSMRIGMARGVYSNEAGVGSSAIAHANVETNSPVKQGLYGIFEVFADTIIMCTLTALVVLSSGATLPHDANVSGASIVLEAFSSVIGEQAASVFLAITLLLFAYTSIIGWSVYGLSSAKFLFGEKAKKPYCIIFTVLTAIGALMRVDFAWKCGEILNYLMAAPNIIALILLLSDVKKEVSFYE